jgi:hypothetical protein
MITRPLFKLRSGIPVEKSDLGCWWNIKFSLMPKVQMRSKLFDYKKKAEDFFKIWVTSQQLQFLT